MIAGTFPTVTRSPLKSPQPMPTPTASAAAAITGRPGCAESVSALMKADSPTIEPTERSMFRVSTTIVWPTATTTTVATLRAMFRQLPEVRKASERRAKKTMATRSATAMPSSRSRKAVTASVWSETAGAGRLTRPPPSRRRSRRP